LFQELHAVPCSFICRVKDNAAYEVQEARALSPAAVQAGVVYDAVLRRLGTAHHTRVLPQPFRVVRVATGKTRKDGTPDVLVLVTNRLDLDAEWIAVASRYRWAVELFFRWVKCVLGCRHLLSQGLNGVRLQVYAALIASLLISLWVGRAPTKRTYEMLCFYLSGWASEEEVVAHIDRLHLKAPPTCKN
jgi:IS4 transposase